MSIATRPNAQPDTKRFSWSEDLHPRGPKGRFTHTWRELLDVFHEKEKAYDEFDITDHVPELTAPGLTSQRYDEILNNSGIRVHRDRIEVELTDAESDLYSWLAADKGLEVPAPPGIAALFAKARKAEDGAPDLDSLEKRYQDDVSDEPIPVPGTSIYAHPDRVGPIHKAFEAYAVDQIRLAVNTKLREKKTLKTDPQVKAVVETMDRAFAEAPATTEHLVAIRGLSMAEPPDVGDVIVDQGYSSMIGDGETATHFALGRAAKIGPYANQMKSDATGLPPVLVEVLIPAGSKVITDGWETITPRGSVFEIIGRRGNGILIALLRPPGTMEARGAA